MVQTLETGDFLLQVTAIQLNAISTKRGGFIYSHTQDVMEFHMASDRASKDAVSYSSLGSDILFGGCISTWTL